MSSSEDEDDIQIVNDKAEENDTSSRRSRSRRRAAPAEEEEEEEQEEKQEEEEPSESPISEHDENTIRIMLSTDNHLGYCEGDAVRGMDSFAALEEVLWLARHYEVDLVLLAGDLFHMNKPSRGTLHKTMDLFRRYCMGDNPIQIQILSNQSQNFRNGLVNYEDENYSVDLPVFSIHGNHDDPTREAGTTDLFCALDLLDVANLVNYFGKQDEINKVQISPILMKKGSTHLALYGLGSMRDERLHRMWRSQQLKFLRPEPPPTAEGEDAAAWFNLFALHQNRDFGRGSKNCIQETMIPEWMDLVCWGHEHESCVEPSESVVGTFRITQPGSSVATSLSAGEAEMKQIGILDIRGNNYRIQPIPLTQVRSFTRGDINLADIEGLNPDGPKVDKEVTAELDERVKVLIHDAREKIQETLQEAEQKGNVLAAMEDVPLKYKLQKPESVLVRLNVDHSGFSVLNNQRFGAKFVGEVANPTDILLYSRKKAAPQKKSSNKKLSEIEPIEPDQEINISTVSTLIVGELENSDQKMEVFDEKRMTSALDSYVDKQEAQAIAESVETLLNKEQKKWIKKGSTPSKADSTKKEETTSKKRGRKASAKDDSFDSEEEEPSPPPKKKRSRKAVAKNDSFDSEEDEPSPPPKKKRGRKAVAKDDSFDSEEEEPSPPKKKRGSRAAPKKKAASRRNTKDYSDDSEVSEVEVDDSPPPKKKSARASRSRQKAQPKYTVSSEDEEIEEVEPPPKKRSTARGGATKKKASRRSSMSDSDDDDIEVLDDPPPAKKRSRRSATSQSSRDVSSLSQSQLSFAPIQKKSRKKKGKLYDDSQEMEDGWGTAKTDTVE